MPTPNRSKTNNNEYVQVGRGQHVRPGEYKISPTNIKLVVGRSSAKLVLLTGYPSSVVVEVPLEGFVVQDPLDVAARAEVVGYVSAAWASHQLPQIMEWMESLEESEGVSVWHRYLIHGRNMAGEPDFDLNRQLVEQEVEAWLRTQSQSQSPS